MPKFRKFHSVQGTFVLVPDSYYNRLLDRIRCSPNGTAFTRMYVYFLDSDNVMWRYPRDWAFVDFHSLRYGERVISQFQFNPEVCFV